MNRSLLSSLLLSSLLFTMSIGHSKAQTSRAMIPFELSPFNNILIKAKLNQVDTLKLMFHSGSNGVTVTRQAALRLSSLTFQDTASGISSWGGGRNSSRVSSKNRLELGPVKLSDVEILENENSGQGSDGKFGMSLFQNVAGIELDFDRGQLVVHKSLPKELDGYVKYPVRLAEGEVFIEGHTLLNDEPLSAEFMLHTGYAGGLLFNDQFAAQHHLRDKLKITGERKLKDSFGNTVTTIKAELPRLQLGSLILKDVPAGFFAGTVGRQTKNVMGGDVIKRFNWILDLRNSVAYLKPSKYVHTTYFK